MARSPSLARNPARVPENIDDGLDPQKTRRRGRPLESSNDAGVSKRRRSQVRRAQEAFRRRKDAATKSLEQRVGLLEECIEQMSNRFIEFTDSLCKSPAIRQDPQLLRHSLIATSKILDLAQRVNMNLNNDDDYVGNSDAVLNVSTRDISEISHPRGPAASGTAMSISSQMLAQHFEFEAGIRTWNTQARFMNSFRLPPYGIRSYTDDVIGDSWLGQNPISVIDRRLIANERGRREHGGSFGLKLLQSTLDIAYSYLLGESNASAAVATQMFRFALLHHSREEILFKMRWFLGPGLQYMSNLGNAFIMPEDIEDLWDSFFVLSPSVDKDAVKEIGAGAISSLFLSAFGVEEYLKSRGAIYEDNDTIIMKVQIATTGSDTSGISSPSQSLTFSLDIPEANFTPEFLQKYAKVQNSSKISHTSLQDSQVAPSESPAGHSLQKSPGSRTSKDASQASGFMNGFFIDSLLPAGGLQSMKIPSDSSWVTRISSHSNGTVTINASQLIQIITHNAFCLGNGPGFPRSAVDHVINALTTEILVL